MLLPLDDIWIIFVLISDKSTVKTIGYSNYYSIIVCSKLTKFQADNLLVVNNLIQTNRQLKRVLLQTRLRPMLHMYVWELCFFTFGPRGRRAHSARRPRGQNVAAIALDMGQAHLWYKNNTMQTIHAIQPLRTVCGFLDMGDGCCLIFNKNQLVFIVIKSITAQIKKKIILFFS